MNWLIYTLIYIAVIAVILSVPKVREFNVLNWDPFLSLQFFIAVIPMVVAMLAAKRLFRQILSFTSLLFILNAIYLLFLFSKPVHIFIFGGYYYFVHQLSLHTDWKYSRLLSLGFCVLPLLLSRSTKEVQFLGLSYITFRAFHLIMEREKFRQIDFRSYFVFLTFFPSVLAGPIDRFGRFKSDLDTGYDGLSYSSFANGLFLIVFGLFQKFVLSEFIRQWALERVIVGFAQHWIDMYFYSAFLYLDFAGYSAMAIGLGGLFGIQLPENFNKPFLSKNPQDFWQRFHITLGQWLKDYFFLPLYKWFHSSSKLKSWPLLQQNAALILTFLLMGYWNGSQKHYLISGLLFGVYSAAHNSYLYYVRRGRLTDYFGHMGRFGRALAIFITVNFACMALYIFSGRLSI